MATIRVKEIDRLKAAFIESSPPLITSALCLLLIAVFAMEQFFPIAGAVGLVPGVRTTLAFGSLDQSRVLHGEWWRLFTSPLLHGGPAHLLTDTVALMGVGSLLEPMLGRAWFGGLLVLCAISSGAASLLMLAPDSASVGTTGVVMGVLAANAVCSFHYEDKNQRIKSLKISGYYLIPALYRTFTPQGFLVDISAHVAGALFGFGFGLFLLLIWPKGNKKPLASWAGELLVVIFTCVSVSSFIYLLEHRHIYVEKNAELIPYNDFPRLTTDAIARSEKYVARYPKDPRARDFRGMFYLARGQNAKAESEFRTAVRVAPDSLLSLDILDQSRAFLAVTLWREGRASEAEIAVGSSCNSKDNDLQFQKLLKVLREVYICGR